MGAKWAKGMPVRAGAVAPAQRRVLLLGESGSGKTALLLRLGEFAQRGTVGLSDLSDIIPTVGVEVSEFQFHKTPILVREVGGQMAALWSEYYAGCDMVLYAVDLGNRPQICSVMVRLMGLLQAKGLEGKRLLVLLNKADCPRPMNRAEVDFSSGLGLLEASNERVASVTVSATEGVGLEEVLEHIRKG